MLDTSCGAYFSVIIREVLKHKRSVCLFCAFYFDVAYVALDLLMVGVSFFFYCGWALFGNCAAGK